VFDTEENAMRKSIRCVSALILIALQIGANGRSERFLVSAIFKDTGKECTSQQELDDQSLRLTSEMADQFEAKLSETCKFWTRESLPHWDEPCSVNAVIGADQPAGGTTTFTFENGRVHTWIMNVTATPELMRSSVMPHEASHMVFASFCLCPLPRWMDEGAATYLECAAERVKLAYALRTAVRENTVNPYAEIFFQMDYPADTDKKVQNAKMVKLYAQSMVMSDYLIENGGPHKYFAFVRAGCSNRRWDVALKSYYGLTLDQFVAACLNRQKIIAESDSATLQLLCGPRYVPTVDGAGVQTAMPVIAPKTEYAPIVSALNVPVVSPRQYQHVIVIGARRRH
jgi:hypothetical protein